MGYKTYNCPISRQCGGCEWLNVPYPIQLERKQAEVEELFDSLCDNALIYPIDGMDDPTRCRNKVIVPFAPGKKGSIVYGLYAKGSHRVVQKDDCLVEDAVAAPILKTIAKLAQSFKLRPFDEKTGHGFLRYALLRISRSTGEVLVCLVCGGEMLKGSKAFVRELRKRHPEVATVVLNVNSRSTNVVLGEREHTLYGKGWIEDELLGCKFRISAQSFFQVNPRQTEKLYSHALDMAGISDGTTVLDAYCGTGTIGILAAKRGASVVGVESNAAAVRDARSNARRNGIDGIEFETADASQFIRRCANDGDSFDVVIMDPPRAGSDEKFLKALARMAPQKVVYISCNPKTQARDCALLLDNGYYINKVQPVDMFPHTPHVESVALLASED